MTLSAIVVGCGAVGAGYQGTMSHGGAYAAHPATELVAGVDTDGGARAAFAERFDVPAYASLRDALARHRPALASIAIPAGDRLEAVRAVIEGGVRAVWAEKPLAPTVEAAERIVRLCDEAGVALQVNFLRRFDSLHRRVAEELVSRSALRLDFRFSGAWEVTGVHALDLMRMLAGEATSVRRAGGVVVVETERGEATFAQVSGDVFDVVVYDGGSRLVLTAHGEELRRAEPEESKVFPGYRTLGSGDVAAAGGLAEAMIGGVTSIVEHLERGTPLACDGGDGVAAQRLLAEAVAA